HFLFILLLMMNTLTRKFFVFTLTAFVSLRMYGGEGHIAKSETNIRFTENKTQWDKKILYKADLDGGVLFIEKNCFTYNFYDKETLLENHIAANKKPAHTTIATHSFRM